MEKKQIEAQVRTLLKAFGYRFNQDDYVNIIDFVHSLGFIVDNARHRTGVVIQFILSLSLLRRLSQNAHVLAPPDPEEDLTGMSKQKTGKVREGEKETERETYLLCINKNASRLFVLRN